MKNYQTSTTLIKGIKRFFLHEFIGPAVHGIIIIGRQLIKRPGKRDRQLTGRGCFAKQNICYCISTFFPGVPDQEHGICSFLDLSKIHGRSTHYNCNYRVIVAFFQRLYIFHLVTGQIIIQPVTKMRRSNGYSNGWCE